MPLVMNKIAWEILLPDEKMALSLQLGMDKSSWESGEILGRSHYKYLEIKYRAENFLKIFTEHLDLYESIIPPYVSGDRIVIEYFTLCIVKRTKPLAALKIISDNRGSRVLKSTLNEKIIFQLKAWDRGENAHDKTIFGLVKEFDRWNNFRILPKEVQEPSAFKRRVKNSYKRQIRMACSMHELSVARIKKMYETKKSPSIYIPLIQQKAPIILRLKITLGSWNVINTIGLYAFTRKEDADEYIQALYHYIGKGKKDCTDGLEFWPKYRLLIQKAQNYNVVMQISSSRKHLQYALKKLEFV